MEKLNNEISDMYTELTEGTDDVSANQKSIDFTSIRDSFRQHIHNRRCADSSGKVLLDDQVIRDLVALKREIFYVLQKFQRKGHEPSKTDGSLKTFSTFDEFMSFMVNQEEILSSELWKLEAIFSFLETFSFVNPPAL